MRSVPAFVAGSLPALTMRFVVITTVQPANESRVLFVVGRRTTSSWGNHSAALLRLCETFVETKLWRVRSATMRSLSSLFLLPQFAVEAQPRS
jgi:hypothetical protein